MIKPKKLEKGDTIAILSPSGGLGGIFPYRVFRGIKFLKKLGFDVKEYPTARKVIVGGKAGTPEERVKDIHDAFKDKNIKAIIAVIGGLFTNEILDLIDYDLIKNNPKIFCGYSDNTLFCNALFKKLNLISFYGPCVMTQFAEYPEPFNYTIKYFLKAISNSKPIGEITPSEFWTDEILDWTNKEDLKRPRKLVKNEGYVWLRGGRVTAQIVGGCLYSIHQLKGTSYFLDYSNKILFIDISEGQDFTKGEPLPYIDSKLQDLKNIGLFKNIKGLIVGRGLRYNKEEIIQLKNIIKEHTKNYDFPILFGADVGHSDPIITIPFGVKATLDSYNNKFSIDDAGVIN